MTTEFDAACYAQITDHLIVLHLTGNHDDAIEYASEMALLFPLETKIAIEAAAEETRYILQFNGAQQ